MRSPVRKFPWISLSAALVAVTVLSACALGQRGASGKTAPTVDALLEQMTLEQKIGQMIQAGFPGKTPGYEVRTLIREHFIGGVILFARNVDDPAQVAYLTNELQKLALDSGAGIPLMVSADQEGGWVLRINQGVSIFPGNMALGATRSEEDAFLAGKYTARELRAMGINMNLAPVVDVNNNPRNPVIGVRSFGEDPAWVARLGAAMARGLQEGGVIATAKHFPGHGDTSVDSHIALPTVPWDRKRLFEVELKPFQAVIDSGIDAIMTAHVTFPAIDPTPGMPATLSAKVLTGLLRQELGFQGLIITDAMEMGAITKNFGVKEAAVTAVKAGADVLLVAWPTNWDMAIDVIEGIREAVASGEITEARIDASVRRILTLKQKRGILDQPLVDLRALDGTLAAPDALQAAAKASADAITLIKNERGILPLTSAKAGRVLVISPQLSALTQVEELGAARSSLGRAVRRHHGAVTELVVATSPTTSQINQALAAARSADTIVVGTYQAWKNTAQASLVNQLLTLGKPVIVAALREPYDLEKFPNVPVYVATYSATPPSMDALGDVLFGKAAARGKLPVSIPGQFAAGHGL